MSLMGPGAMTEYSAPSRGRRARGTVYVDDPAVGFFVAGSSLTEMNGIYTRRNDHGALPGFRVALCYGHSGKNGWFVALCSEVKERAARKTVARRRRPRYDDDDDDDDWETDDSGDLVNDDALRVQISAWQIKKTNNPVRNDCGEEEDVYDF